MSTTSVLCRIPPPPRLSLFERPIFVRQISSLINTYVDLSGVKVVTIIFTSLLGLAVLCLGGSLIFQGKLNEAVMGSNLI